MKIKDIYQNIRSKIKKHFGYKRDNLTQEQREYVLSGINPSLLENYKIIYSPGSLYFKKHEKGTKITNNLERKVESLTSSNNLKELKQTHLKNMETIWLNHLRKLNEIYSSFVDSLYKVYNEGMERVRDIFIRNKRDGSLSINFV